MPDKNKHSSWKCAICGMRTAVKCQCGVPVCKQVVHINKKQVTKDC